MQSQPDPSEFNYMQTLRGASEASSNLGDAIFHHGDAIQHLSEALEDEVAAYARELGTRVSMLHDAAGQISTAGLAIARAGERIASCGEYLALGMQQMVIVVAAGMLTCVAGVFGWQYLVLGCVVLLLCGFEVKLLQRNPLPRRQAHQHQQQQQQHQQQQQQGPPSHSGGAHLHSAMHCPVAGEQPSPKRVSWERGIDGSQANTDSGAATPHSDLGQSPRTVDGTRHQGLDGVYVSSHVAPPAPGVATGDGDGANSSAALAAGAQAAARDGVATLRSGGVTVVRSDAGATDGSCNGSVPATTGVVAAAGLADVVGAPTAGGAPLGARIAGLPAAV